jgi:hypothetical protein
MNKASKERIIEQHLRFYNTYLTGIKNCEQQLEYITPSLVFRYDPLEPAAYWYIPNNTEHVAIDRIESKRALDLKEQIERFKIITRSIENAMKDLKQQEKDFVQHRYFDCLPIQEVKGKLGFNEERSVYRIRRHVLEKLLISLNNLLSLN